MTMTTTATPTYRYIFLLPFFSPPRPRPATSYDMSDLDRPRCRLVIRVSLHGAGITSSHMEKPAAASGLRSGPPASGSGGPWAVLSIGRRNLGDTCHPYPGSPSSGSSSFDGPMA